MSKGLPDADLTPEQRALEADLRRSVSGEVGIDNLTRALYATDASIYQEAPLAVVVPRDADDISNAIDVARERGLSVLPRGAGTSLAGQATGGAVVLDLSKFMNRVLEVDEKARWVRVEPGVVRDQLNEALAPTGLHFAPETATSNRACIGGMIGNNSAGTRSIRYGQTCNRVLELSVLLATGERLELGRLDPEAWARKAAQPDREGELYRGVQRIVERNRAAIDARFPKVMRRLGGYRLDAFAPGADWSLADLVAGSEGTLCTMLEAKLALDPIPGGRALCIAHFSDLTEALRAVPTIVDQGPSAVEMLDRTVIHLARTTFGSRWRYNWLEGEPEAVLIVEVLADDAEGAQAQRAALISRMQKQGVGRVWTLADGSDQAEVWEVRKAGLGLLLGIRTEAKPIPFIEDSAVPVDRLADYITDVLALCKEQGAEVAMYAHASVGLLHVRPLLDLKRADDVERMKAISQGTVELVQRYGGSFSGEHGDGRVRSYALPQLFGPELYRAFGEVKRLFDPQGLMNPGKIVDPAPMDSDLRLGPDYRAPERGTYFHYRDDGGFSASVELCSGVGACRKIGSGTMCPSYMATRDEADSTRGRANALRLAMSGQLGPEGMTGPELRRVFDLCLSCKGCKSECPSSVDVGRLKAEFLAGYHARHGATAGDRFFAMAPKAAAMLSGRLAPLVNRVASSRPMRVAMERALGLDARRPLPPFATEPFHVWFERRSSTKAEGTGRQVALFADTFLNYHQPAVGRAAVAVLEALGYRPLLLSGHCCGRTQISRGFLADAREVGTRTLERVAELAEQDIPVLACEPGCYSSLVGDLPDLVEDAALGQRAAAAVHMLDVFLADELERNAVDSASLQRRGAERVQDGLRYLVHGHCHQKATTGTDATRWLLEHFSGAEVEDIDAGCCGMAGSFGYEKAHYDVSQRIGEDRLFPAIRRAPAGTTVIASGFSCRHQVSDALGVQAVHVIEELALLIA